MIFISANYAQSYKVTNSSEYFKLPNNVSKKDYIPGKIIFKVKDSFQDKCKNSSLEIEKINEIFSAAGIISFTKKFPNKIPLKQKYTPAGDKLTDLSLIYEADFEGPNIEKSINNLLASGYFEYAQPHYIFYPLCSQPNDALYPQQYHLAITKACEGWDISKGDSNIVVGITDWGFDITHEDLAPNIKYNLNDPIDGIDNDNDGYIDNYMGWNMGSNNNNPQFNASRHGVYSAGVSSARTNNTLGVSGSGYNCKFLPVKVDNAAGEGTMTFEGIVYAADHGCSVINCSWGGSYYPGQYGQDIINYATFDRNALVVCAAGNSNSMVPIYPAAYENALSVAGSNSTDSKWSNSSYGWSVDIAAPGQEIWTTNAYNQYDYSSGTSFASPIVAGYAAIVKSYFPEMTALQVGEQLKVHSDIIDTLTQNLPYKNLLGAGRVNLFKALTDTMSPSVVMTNINFNKSIIRPLDTLKIKGGFRNYLHSTTSGFKVTLTSSSPYVTIVDSVLNAGVIPKMGILYNNSVPFKVFIKPNTPLNEAIVLKLNYTDNNYSAFQFITIVANAGFINIDTNKVATTITSNGMIGYNKGISTDGLGFIYNDGRSIMACGGLLMGSTPQNILDVIYGDTIQYNNDFYPVVLPYRVIPPVISDFQISSTLKDTIPLGSSINVLINCNSFAWSNSNNSKYIINEYAIINKGPNNITNFYTGLYMDWDIDYYLYNKASFDPTTKMGYCYPSGGGTHAGIKLLTAGAAVNYCFDNDGANGSIKINDGFLKAEKYLAMTNNRSLAGIVGSGNDVSDMVSSGPHDLNAGDTVIVAFALIGGDNLGDLKLSAIAAQNKYDNPFAKINFSDKSQSGISQNYPNPFREYSNIDIFIPEGGFVNIELFDYLGKKVMTLLNKNVNPGVTTILIDGTELESGMYYYKITTENFEMTKKITIIK
jgi:hypothetical protein